MVMEYKLAVVIRDDLGLSKGKMAVQVAHAAVSCAQISRRSHRRWFKAWMGEGQRKVVLRVEDLESLRDLEDRARPLDLTTKMIIDAGLTEVPPGTTTCLGIGPGPEELIDKVTGQLRLL
ncbi:MAG: peptidyl-tRNA hydrolase Pth2 [Candidatus Thermoplasmatota archaeon]|nr:peptidyl-tRNA hydrolase Pth2 [Candidatus Thermoplasmatota archaeon]